MSSPCSEPLVSSWSLGLNGTFTADGTQVNGKQVYSQGHLDSLECACVLYSYTSACQN